MFESLLARRYIFSQKRHTILTVCSIAISLALITMLFTGFSTAVKCWRNVVYDREGAYHVSFSVSEDQTKAVEEYFAEYGVCTFDEDPYEGIYAYLLFDEYIGDLNIFMDRMFRAVGKSPMTVVRKNDALMMLDMIDLTARAELVIIFAVFYIFVLFFIIALRLVIDTAFEVSSKERERQFGVLQSIGATPKQIVRIITYEGIFLSVVGIPIGVAAGIGLGFAAFKAVVNSGLSEVFFTPEKAAELLRFHISPLLLLIGVVTGIVWIFLSAYGTGMRIIKMSPIQAISARSNTVNKVKKHSLFGFLFGWKGRLASRNNRRQPKRFLTTVISLTLSIALFASFSFIINRIQTLAYIIQSQESMNFESDLSVNTFHFTSESFIDAYTKWAFDPMYYREALDTIENSGYFKDVKFYTFTKGTCYDHGVESIDGPVSVYIFYYHRDSYNKLFGGEPPVSYDELTKQKGYVLLIDDVWKTGEYFADRDSISLDVTQRINLTANEYFALTPEEQELARPHEHHDGDTDTTSILFYSMDKEQTIELPISGAADGIRTEYFHNDIITLAGTLDEYENGECWLYGNAGSYMDTVISFDLADESKYQEALDFIEKQDSFHLNENNYAERLQINARFAAVRAGGVFLNVMIALVAIVNMVNIISTGILNRRGELASMQCVGMTERQLYGMTVVECLQYVLTAAVTALILCELLMLGTDRFLTKLAIDELGSLGAVSVLSVLSEYGGVISYITLIPKILLAAAGSFITAFLASVIPLRQMQSTSLVEQIQSVD